MNQELIKRLQAYIEREWLTRKQTGLAQGLAMIPPAGEIEQLLTNCLSALTAQQSQEPVEWIKCADTLPTPHKDYWLCIEGAKFATIGRLNHQFNEDLYWCLENGNKGNDLPYAEVTHYAEIVRPDLPALPEDK